VRAGVGRWADGGRRRAAPRRSQHAARAAAVAPDPPASKKVVTETDLGVGRKAVGKVRDIYATEDAVVIATTDRQSAFDRILASVPYKGQVLNQTAAWWFGKTGHIIKNAFLAAPDPNVTVMRKAEVFPVEFVVRGYITGTTSTSLWTVYNKGQREYCGNVFPDGLRKNDKLPANVLTPTTKAADHDEPISPAEIVSRGLMTQAQWDEASSKALELFAFGQEVAARNGMLLVDTKYEMGLDADGDVVLIDEVHTPDSSRWWVAGTYEPRHAAGEEPENIDKEFLRLWFAANCDPYKDAVLPEAPQELVEELSRRYVQLYETITGETFVPEDSGAEPSERMRRNTLKCMQQLGLSTEAP